MKPHFTNTGNPVDFPKMDNNVMNERIRELAVNAGYGTRWTSTEQFEQFMDQFALLIARECVKEIESQYGGGSDQPMDSEWDRAIECASSMVKHRFGVGG